MDLSDQARALRHRWLVVAAVVVIGLAALAIFGRGARPMYQATAVLVFDETGNPPRDAFVQDLTAAAALARTPTVASKAAARLNALNSPDDLARKITARANVAANAVEITTVPYASASKARQLADAFAAELAGSLTDQQDALSARSSDAATADQVSIAEQLKTTEAKLAAAGKAPVDQQEMLRAQRDAILRHLQETIVNDLSVPRQQNLTSLGGAAAHTVDHSRLAPTTVPGWMLAAGVLAFLGGAIALVAERIDGRLRSRTAVERAFGLPVLAEVPPLDSDDGVVAATQPLSSAADAFRDLRSSLARLGRPPVRHGNARGTQLDLTAALITSAGPGEGKTSTAVNLAAAVAETGKSVLVIDCDMRAPDAHEHLGVDPGPGLSDVLLGAATLDQVAVPTSVPGVRLVGAGRSTQNPPALLARQQDFVSLARMLADFVILDAPPLTVHDAAELVWMVDAVVVACRSGDTTTKAAERVQEVLALLGAPPGGVVLFASSATGDRREGNGAATQPLPAVETFPAPPPPPPPTAPTASPATPPPTPPMSPAGSGGPASMAYPSSGSVGVLARPASPPAPPQTSAEPETVDWATRTESQQTEADSAAIRRQLALPARRVAGWAGTVALMVVLWVIIRSFLFQSFYIPSPSMTPALKPGDRVLVSKLSYRLHDIHRGDIVVFKRPPHVQAGPEVKDLVKRVIGLPGDTVEARDGQLIVNGKILREPYVPKGASTTPVSPQHIPAKHYWVMGDNRTVSEDSRYFGSIAGNLIVGRVFFQVWPVSSLGFV